MVRLSNHEQDYDTVSDGRDRGEDALNFWFFRLSCEEGLGDCTADQPEADQPQFSRLRRGGRGVKSF